MAKTRPRPGRPAAEPETIEMPAVDDVAKLRQYHQEIGDILAKIDPNRSPFDRVSYHVRRHAPLYALIAIFALVIAIAPTRNNGGGDTAEELTPGGDSSAFEDDGSTGDATTKGRTKRRTTTGGDAGPIAGPVNVPGKKPLGKVLVGTGTTIGGFECAPGVRQLPWSLYANPCISKFSGNNGGNTYRGVDAKTIKIGIRKPAVDAGDVTDAQARAQEAATRAEGIDLLKKYTGYFNKTFELFGRKVEFIDFQSRTSNGIEEAQSRGEEGACADATDLAETHKVFGVVGYNGGLTETQPFADCASDKGLFVPFGASYFPEKWYQERWDPYVYHVLQECERIAHDVAEYLGKRLNNRNAVHALDPLYRNKKRIFGTYVPDNDGYQRCVNISETDFKNKYGGKITSRYDYLLDVARFPDQARQGVLQFKADGVTTLINACDTLSSRFLSESADDFDWGPEWFIIGVATQDTDGAARTFDQNVVDGHLFGMSQLGKTSAIEGTAGESYKSWKTAFPNEDPQRGYGAVYYRTIALFIMLQSAGPTLTPANIGRGLRVLPDGGGEKGPYGTWSFKGDHTAVDDSREIYWVCKWDPTANNRRGACTGPKGYDGDPGTYLETYGGKRFRTGQWPKEGPPVYPKK